MHAIVITNTLSLDLFIMLIMTVILIVDMCPSGGVHLRTGQVKEGGGGGRRGKT